jgi:hypothetical protein
VFLAAQEGIRREKSSQVWFEILNLGIMSKLSSCKQFIIQSNFSGNFPPLSVFSATSVSEK